MNWISSTSPSRIPASPAEVEEGIILVLEEAVRGLDGVKRVTSRAGENMGSVTLELQLGSDTQKMVSDIKNAVDQIQSFPVDAERPTVQLISRRKEVISIALHGEVPRDVLKASAEDIRTDLQNYKEITQVGIDGVITDEISIEIDKETLRAHGLSLRGVAETIRASSLELPAGGIKTPEGEVLLRTNERKRIGQEFESIKVISGADGQEVELKEIATVQDDVREVDAEAWFNGEPAVIIKVFRVGSQTPLEIAALVKDYLAAVQDEIPQGLQLSLWQDQSKIYAQRIDLLLRNAGLGLILVLFVLGLFLEVRLAFWVTMGIPISFLGSMLILPYMGVSINMISLFGFIVTLGMVVDDAIIVGESIYFRRQKGQGILRAAVEGAREVAMPVTFAIMTTIAAFGPLFMVPGVSGKFFRVIPAVVVSVLLMSLIESIFILPAHLAHTSRAKTSGFMGVLNRGQRVFGRGLERFVEQVYAPVLRACLRWKSLTLAFCAVMFMVGMAYWTSGRLEFTFMPKVDFDRVTVQARLPYGVSVDETREFLDRLQRSAIEVLEEAGEPDAALGTYAQIGSSTQGNGPGAGQASFLGGHACSVTIRMSAIDERSISVREFTEKWREKVGKPASLESLDFKYSMGPGAGPDITLQLAHPDAAVLKQAGEELAAKLMEYEGVKDVNDGFAPGKKQFNFELTDAGRSAGFTAASVGRALRDSYFGAEVLRQARGREEMRVYVRLPREERESVYTLNDFTLAIPGGAKCPFRKRLRSFRVDRLWRSDGVMEAGL